MSYKRQGKKRVYKKIDSQAIAEFIAVKAMTNGNGTEAIRTLSPEHTAPHARANELVTKADTMLSPNDLITQQLQSNAVKGVMKINELIDSEKDSVALQASIFSVEQQSGKALQRTHNINANINIQSVLD